MFKLENRNYYKFGTRQWKSQYFQRVKENEENIHFPVFLGNIIMSRVNMEKVMY